MRYRPDLDGIRALAVIGVLFNHTAINTLNGGWMGVDVFFVLSGYLITALMIREHDTNGRVRFGAFYARRALRLVPALVVMVIIAGPVLRYLPLDPVSWGDYGREAVSSLLYIHDFTSAYHWFVGGGLGHTWSLGVEEQFYLLWPPILVILLRRRSNPLPWALGGAVASWLLLAYDCRTNGPDGYPTGYYLPWDRFSQVLIGAAVAVYLHRRQAPEWTRRPAIGWALVVAAGALVLIAGQLFRFPHLAWQAPAIALITAALLIHLDASDGTLRKLLGRKPLAYLGRRSYGFYLYLIPTIQVLDARLMPNTGKLGTPAIEFAVTLALAVLSYRYVELPFLRLKSRFEPRNPVHAAR